jgi:hypothetical protein
METTLTIEVEQSQMQPLEVKLQNKLVEEEVKTVDSKVGTEPLVIIQVETTETRTRQPKA